MTHEIVIAAAAIGLSIAAAISDHNQHQQRKDSPVKDIETRSLTMALVLAFIACVAMLAASHVRGAAAEDDCAMGTWSVQTLRPFADGVACIGEPQP
jgi:hypothetical protein